MKFLDFFSGIGGFRLGLEMADHECAGHCEIDKFANRSYVAMHNPKESEFYAADIQKIKPENLPYADIWCGGFPCQDISVAGKQKGLKGERSGLFFELLRLLKNTKEENKPSILLLENVKNLFSVNKGLDFLEIIYCLDEVGYDCEWQLVNTAWYLPQNRERVYIIGHLRTRSTRKVFPINRTNKKTIKMIRSGNQGDRVYSINGISRSLTSSSGGLGSQTGLYFIDLTKNKPRLTDISRCIKARYTSGITSRLAENSGVLEVKAVLTPNRINKRQNGRRFKEADEPMYTLTRNDIHGVYIKEATKKGYDIAYEGDCINLAVPNSTTRRGRVGKKIANTLDTSCNQGTLVEGKIRRLTPKECFRLQGFPDEYYEKAAAVNSDSQLYKQAGNSVSIPVVYEIAQRL